MTALDRAPNVNFTLASWRSSTHDIPIDDTSENPGGWRSSTPSRHRPHPIGRKIEALLSRALERQDGDIARISDLRNAQRRRSGRKRSTRSAPQIASTIPSGGEGENLPTPRNQSPLRQLS